MYEFYYNYIERKFNAKLMFTETDNLLYEIETNDVYKVFLKIRICLVLVIIQEIQSFLILLLGKRKMNSKEK